MKRLWFILLLLGFIVSFSTSAMAVDVKVSGEYYAAGMYLNKISVDKATESMSTAFYFQRLRVKTDFVVSPGLLLTTRFDAMERIWGAARSAPGQTAMVDSAGTIAENENIALDWTYLTYVSPIGAFSVGYMNDYVWGTAFGDSSVPGAKIAWAGKFGSWTTILQIIKAKDNGYTAVNNTAAASDRDEDHYIAAFKYNWKTGSTGVLARYFHDASIRTNTSTSGRSDYMVVLPYIQATAGPVAVEAELNYAFGKYAIFDNDTEPNYNLADRRMDSLSVYVNAVVDLGMFYAGGTFVYIGGQDPNTDRAQGALSGGRDWNPCLILWNNDKNIWQGGITGAGGSANSGRMNNVWFFQVKGGARPVDKLDIGLALSYANAVVKPTNAWLNNSYGFEADVTATYKITNNLSYVLGMGYLFTGDYFKGENPAASLRDDYLVINKLTLTF